MEIIRIRLSPICQGPGITDQVLRDLAKQMSTAFLRSAIFMKQRLNFRDKGLNAIKSFQGLAGIFINSKN